MARKQFVHAYYDIISVENLLEAWRDFARGKRKKQDVQEFDRGIMQNIFVLHEELRTFRYVHGAYHSFKINDPKPRDIHKAPVRDRLVHHAIYRVLYAFFDNTFITDSYSCRRWKGTHKALRRFEVLSRKVSKNHTRTVWVLKCDIRKFFASIDHRILLMILRNYISDNKVLWLIYAVVGSFNSGKEHVGLPLGNLTSQLLVNIYMNKFGQFVKHKLKGKNYIRYADDFVLVSEEKKLLEDYLLKIREFLCSGLKLELHPDKVSIKTLASGVDFLGWVHFPQHRVLRTTTKKRMFRNIKVKNAKEETVLSYLGLISHGNGWRLKQKILKEKQTLPS